MRGRSPNRSTGRSERRRCDIDRPERTEFASDTKDRRAGGPDVIDNQDPSAGRGMSRCLGAGEATQWCKRYVEAVQPVSADLRLDAQPPKHGDHRNSQLRSDAPRDQLGLVVATLSTPLRRRRNPRRNVTRRNYRLRQPP